jgi:GMP synthase-like glutamine amidotransferase
MRVLVLANRDDPETGLIGDALVDRGATLHRVWRDDVADPMPATDEHDLVLVLGSEWSVHWEHLAPAVEREATFLRACVSTSVPVLGICYGAQILAHALGGAVEVAPGGGEIGWFTIDSDVPEQIPAGPYMQWHTDRFSLPPGAVELARSPVGPQAYAYGSALGVQFHPEVTPEIVGRWAEGGVAALEERGMTPDGLVAESREHAQAASQRATLIVDTFLSADLATPAELGDTSSQ